MKKYKLNRYMATSLIALLWTVAQAGTPDHLIPWTVRNFTNQTVPDSIKININGNIIKSLTISALYGNDITSTLNEQNIVIGGQTTSPVTIGYTYSTMGPEWGVINQWGGTIMFLDLNTHSLEQHVIPYTECGILSLSQFIYIDIYKKSGKFYANINDGNNNNYCTINF